MKKKFKLLKVACKVYVSVFKRHRFLFVLLNLLTVLSGVNPTIIVFVIGLLISSIIGSLEVNQILPLPFIYAASILGLILVQAFLSLVTSKISLNISFKNQRYHEAVMIETIKKTHMQNFEDKSFLNSFQMAGNGIGHVDSITMIIPQLLSIIISSVSLLVFISQVSFIFGLIFFFTTIPIFIFNAKFGTQRWKLDKKLAEDSRKMQYYESVLTSPGYSEEIRIFNTQSNFLARWQKIYEKITYEKLKLGKKRMIFGFIGQINTPLAFFLLLIFLIKLILDGGMNVSDINIYIMSAQVFAGNIFNLFGIFSEAYQSTLYINDMYDFIDDVSDGKYYIAQKNLLYKPDMNHVITVTDLSFQYPDQISKALNHVSFEIKQGETIAIVGKNGSGKTTLSKLLLGLLSTENGQIIIDQSHQMNAYVMQDFMCYNFTVNENIFLGDVSRQNDEADIHKYAKSTGVDEFIMTLPKCYETILGKGYEEDGTDLSGGQWQKLAISRAAFAKSDIVILDEPSSALDPRAEAGLYHNFSEIMRDKTAIMISHRLGSTKIADRILVLEGGELVESGTHDELMMRRETYWSMYQKQANWYK